MFGNGPGHQCTLSKESKSIQSMMISLCPPLMISIIYSKEVPGYQLVISLSLTQDMLSGDISSNMPVSDWLNHKINNIGFKSRFL